MKGQEISQISSDVFFLRQPATVKCLVLVNLKLNGTNGLQIEEPMSKDLCQGGPQLC